jgi:hypothetical protein
MKRYLFHMEGTDAVLILAASFAAACGLFAGCGHDPLLINSIEER